MPCVFRQNPSKKSPAKILFARCVTAWYAFDVACVFARNKVQTGEQIPAMLLNCVFVGLGGLVGSVLRYLISFLPLRHESGFPLVTLGINVLGAFLLGLIMAAAGRNPSLDPRTLLFLKVGVCGGFTTFSTFALEAHGLLSGGKPIVAMLYMILSVVLCVFAIFGAQALVR
jgi:CrcB protein